MKWINAEQKVIVTIYDEEHEEHLVKMMSVEEMLDTYTNDGCPTMYSNPERKKGEWIFNPSDAIEMMFTKPKCSECGFESADGGNFCSNCGADMRGEEDGEIR